MTVAAFVPLLVKDKFGARRPPFGEKILFCELPVVTVVGDTEIKSARAAPLTNFCFVTQIAVEAPIVALHWRFATLVRYERTSPSALHVGNSGSAGHGKNLRYVYRSISANALGVGLKRRARR